jgi:serine/threonine protein kinase
MKVLKKADIEMRGEVQHTLAEKSVMANVRDSPFIAKLYYSFQNGTLVKFQLQIFHTLINLKSETLKFVIQT